MDNKNYRSLGDAYKQMFSEAAEGGKPKPPTGYPVPVPFSPLRPVQVHRTNVEIDVTQPYVGPGEVEKAYYTYPAGFDPTNREDVVKNADHDGSKSRPEASTKTEDIEIIGDYLMEAGLVSEASDVDHFYAHMSDEWKAHIIERCWKGYKPTPGKKAYEKGSCQKA